VRGHRRVPEVVAHARQIGLALAHQQSEHPRHQEHRGGGQEVALDERGDARLGDRPGQLATGADGCGARFHVSAL
jgi:hypothetical protein